MCMRPITALLAALALLAVIPAASNAQTPTPTATAAQDDGTAAEPPEDASKEVKSIYSDYSRDGVIDVCKHAREGLRQALDSIEADFDRDFPDFREAVEAGIQRHDNNRCAEDDDAQATPTATATPDDSLPDPTPTPDAGTLPEPDDSSGDSDDGGALPPPEDGSLPPEDGALPEGGALPEAGAAQPPVATPAVPPPAAAVTPTPTPTPVVVTRSSTDELLVPGIIVGIALLGAAALAATAFGNRSPRVKHAWSEALFRTRSTWADFSDWLKLGR